MADPSVDNFYGLEQSEPEVLKLTPVEGLRPGDSRLETLPGVSPQYDDARISLKDRVENYLGHKINERAFPDQVDEALKSRFGLDDESRKGIVDGYARDIKMNESRRGAQGLRRTMGENAIDATPGLNTTTSLDAAQAYREAKERIAANKAIETGEKRDPSLAERMFSNIFSSNPITASTAALVRHTLGTDSAERRSDYDIVAAYEAKQEADAKRSTAGKIAGAISVAPAFVVENALGGAAARGVVAGAKAAGYAGRGVNAASSFVGQRALGAVATPAMYARSAEEAAAADPSLNISQAYVSKMGYAAAQNLILGQLSKKLPMSAGPVTAGSLAAGSAKIAGRVGLGMAEQQTLDAASTGLNDAVKSATNYSLGLDTKYGTIGGFVHANRTKDPKDRKEAWDHLAVEATTFLAFGLMHQGGGELNLTRAQRTPPASDGSILRQPQMALSRPAEAARPELQQEYMARKIGDIVDAYKPKGLSDTAAAKKAVEVVKAVNDQLKDGVPPAEIKAPESFDRTQKQAVDQLKETIQPSIRADLPKVEPAAQPAAEGVRTAQGKAPWEYESPETLQQDGKTEFFRTAKGSLYARNTETGQTMRVKSDHTGQGHDATDTGLKKPSDRTVYVDADKVSALSAAGLMDLGPQGARVVFMDGKVSLATWNEKHKRWGVSPSSKNIEFSDTPKPGYAPLELWKPKTDVQGATAAYGGMHAGNAMDGKPVSAAEGWAAFKAAKEAADRKAGVRTTQPTKPPQTPPVASEPTRPPETVPPPIAPETKPHEFSGQLAAVELPPSVRSAQSAVLADPAKSPKEKLDYLRGAETLMLDRHAVAGEIPHNEYIRAFADAATRGDAAGVASAIRRTEALIPELRRLNDAEAAGFYESQALPLMRSWSGEKIAPPAAPAGKSKTYVNAEESAKLLGITEDQFLAGPGKTLRSMRDGGSVRYKTADIEAIRAARQPSVEAATRSVLNHTVAAKALADRALADPARGLSPETQKAFREATYNAIDAIPEAHRAELERVKAIEYFSDREALTKYAAENPQNDTEAERYARFVKEGKKIGGLWNKVTGRLLLDGDGRRADGSRSTAAQVHAHEFTHVLEGDNYKHSGTPAWREIYAKEFKDKQLGDYASRRESEAFAEFGRLVYADKVSAAELMKQFPKATKFWLDNGLIPETNKAEYAKPKQVFQGPPVEIGNNHIDTAMPDVNKGMKKPANKIEAEFKERLPAWEEMRREGRLDEVDTEVRAMLDRAMTEAGLTKQEAFVAKAMASSERPTLEQIAADPNFPRMRLSKSEGPVSKQRIGQISTAIVRKLQANSPSMSKVMEQMASEATARVEARQAKGEVQSAEVSNAGNEEVSRRSRSAAAEDVPNFDPATDPVISKFVGDVAARLKAAKTEAEKLAIWNEAQGKVTKKRKKVEREIKRETASEAEAQEAGEEARRIDDARAAAEEAEANPSDPATGTAGRGEPGAGGVDGVAESMRMLAEKQAANQAGPGGQSTGMIADFAAAIGRSPREVLSKAYEAVNNEVRRLAGQIAPAITKLNPRAGEAVGRFAAAPMYGRSLAARLIDNVMGEELKRYTADGKQITAADRVRVGAVIVELRLRHMQDLFLSRRDTLNAEAASQKAAAAAMKPSPAKDKLARLAKKTEIAAKRAQKDADGVKTIVGQKLPGEDPYGNPMLYRTEADFRSALTDPLIQAAIKRYQEHVVPVIEDNYRRSQGLDPTDTIGGETQIPGLPINMKAYRPGDEVRGGVVEFPVGNKGNLRNPKLRKYRYANEAKGNAIGYHLDIADIITDTVTHGAKVAAKAELYRTLVDTGIAKWAEPGQKVTFGEDRGVLFEDVNPPKKTQEASPNQKNLVVDPKAAGEIRQALDADKPSDVPILSAVNGALTKIALASTTEAVYHAKNLFTVLWKPGVNPLDAVRNAHRLIRGDGETKDRIIELSRIGAFKESGFGSGLLVPQTILGRPIKEGKIASFRLGSSIGSRRVNIRGKHLDPTFYLGEFVHALDKTMRLTASDAFDRLERRGLVEGSQTNKRDFINQLGQYNKAVQSKAVKLLRDTGFGPFATAATNFYMQGLRAMTFNPGVKATSFKAAAQLRATYLARILATAGVAATFNYLISGRVDGDDDTPLGSIKIGDKGGKIKHFDLLTFTGLTRGMRETGTLALAEGLRHGENLAKISDNAFHDAAHSFAHPATGPAVAAGYMFVSGNNTLGNKVAETKSTATTETGKKRAAAMGKPGEDTAQWWLNLQAALWNLNPTVAMTSGRNKPPVHNEPGKKPKEVASAEEKIWSILGPFGVKFKTKRAEVSPRKK